MTRTTDQQQQQDQGGGSCLWIRADTRRRRWALGIRIGRGDLVLATGPGRQLAEAETLLGVLAAMSGEDLADFITAGRIRDWFR